MRGDDTMFDPATLFDTMVTSEWNLQPSSVRGVCNVDTAYYTRQLYRLIYGRYDFTLPVSSDKQIAWKHNWLRYLLFGWGSCGVFYTSRYGWIPLPYSVLKLDVQYNPAIIQASSNYALNRPPRGIVGLNCGIIQIYDDFYGMHDIVTHYATKLASMDKGVNVNIMNASLGIYAEVGSAKESQDVKLAYKKATEGEPLVVEIKHPNKGAPREYKTMLANPKNVYLVDKFLDARRTILNQFLTDIGIDNANTDKRERLIESEVNANSEEIAIARDYIADNIQRGFDDINKISGLNLKISIHEGRVKNVWNNLAGIRNVSSDAF